MAPMRSRVGVLENGKGTWRDDEVTKVAEYAAKPQEFITNQENALRLIYNVMRAPNRTRPKTGADPGELRELLHLLAPAVRPAGAPAHSGTMARDPLYVAIREKFGDDASTFTAVGNGRVFSGEDYTKQRARRRAVELIYSVCQGDSEDELPLWEMLRAQREEDDEEEEEEAAGDDAKDGEGDEEEAEDDGGDDDAAQEAAPPPVSHSAGHILRLAGRGAWAAGKVAGRGAWHAGVFVTPYIKSGAAGTASAAARALHRVVEYVERLNERADAQLEQAIHAQKDMQEEMALDGLRESVVRQILEKLDADVEAARYEADKVSAALLLLQRHAALEDPATVNDTIVPAVLGGLNAEG